MSQLGNKPKERNKKTSQLSNELIAAAFGAARDGDLEELRLLFSPSKMIKKDQIKSMVNAKDKEGNSLLLGSIHGAATQNPMHHTTKYLDCISFLISFGIAPEEKDNTGRSAIHWCVLYGRLDLLDFLYRSGADLCAFDADGITCLHLAIGIRSEKLRDKFVEYLCRIASKELLVALDRQKRSALFLAFSIGAIRIFEYLLQANVSPNEVGPDGRQMIIHTIEKGQGKFTQILLKYGASLSTYDPDGFTAIHLAACQENPENIFVLTECVNKTLLSVKDNLGRTPLMYACLMGFDKNVQILLRQKIWILDQDSDGKTALHHTVNNTHCGCAELLCKENKNLINMCDAEGRSAAHDAVIAGNSIILQCLLVNQCDVNAKDHGGHLMSHWIAAYGTLDCLGYLLEYEANLDEADNHGATPLHYGCQKDEKEELTNNRIKVIEILLQNGARLTTADNEGRKAIHWASSSGNISALKILMKFGDEVNSITLEEKMTPLHLASFQGMTDIVSFLVNQKNINIDIRDHVKCTALFYSCTSGHASVAEILLKMGANPDLTDVEGESPSHCAAAIGSVDCLELLCNANADLSSRNKHKDTPVHEAASAGQTDAILFLLQHGCQASPCNSTGATPLHYSVAERHVDATRALLEHKAKVNALVITKESDYVTPLDIALGNSDLASIQLLQKYGARTGHSIAENSALIIQNRWKVYKRRYSGIDSSLKSYPSDSVSTIEKSCDNIKEEEISTKVTEHLEKLSGKLEREEGQDDDAVVEDSDGTNQTSSQTFCYKDISRSQSQKSGEIDCNIKDGKIKNHDRMSNHNHDDITESLKRDALNQIKSSNAECERSDRLLDRIDKLKKKIEIVVKETKEIASSKEFHFVKELSERLKARKRNLQPKLILPEFPTTNS